MKPYNVENHKTGLDALMGAQRVIKFLMTKEEIEEVVKQVESTWKFKHWTTAKSLLGNVVDARLRLLENNKKFEELVVDNLKDIRKGTGRSQIDTAASAKMSSKTIYQVERGAVSPQVSYLVRMYSAMGVDIVEDLLLPKPKYNSDYSNIVIENIKRLRKKLGFTQTDLANSLKIHRNCIYAIENGKASPSLDRLIDISRALCVRLPELFIENKINED